MSELLLELYSEEIPARMQNLAGLDLPARLRLILEPEGLGFVADHSFGATPHRLWFYHPDIPLKSPGRTSEKRGPREDAPVAAIEGFKRTLEGLDATIEIREEKKGKMLFAKVREPGRATADILAEKLPELLAKFPWPKSMRWGSGEARWVRPLRSILCLFGGKVVPFEFAGIKSGNATRGHRFLAPESFTVSDIKDYESKLRTAKVILDGLERKRLIREAADRIATEAGLVHLPDEALLDEVKGLVEWPVPLAAEIDQAFMDLPAEVLVSTMRANQKYLNLREQDDRLARRFVVVANNVADDGGATIIAGNERVLRARLWDARFFWEQDKKASLESRLPKLASMVFHEKLGTQGERVERLVALAGALVPFVPGAERASAERAAMLAKADLVTGMVGEFPELQGIMGGHYARHQGEVLEIATAIAEHYAPKGPDDRCPNAPASIVVALADKLDTLVGFFAAGLLPTGSKDPFALRRAALGIIRLVLENGLRLDLETSTLAALQGHGERFGNTDPATVAANVTAFLMERLKVQQRQLGVRHDVIEAAWHRDKAGDLVRLLARVGALSRFLDSVDGSNLLIAYRRAANILAIEERKDGRAYDGGPDPALAREPEERALLGLLSAAEPLIHGHLQAERFQEALAALASLRQPVDSFFDKVMVNAPEPELRFNRLLTLSRIRSAMDLIADFRLIEEPGKVAAKGQGPGH